MNTTKIFSLSLLLSLLLFACSKKEAKLSVAFPQDFDGNEVELIAFEDSLVLARDTVRAGQALFVTAESDSVRFPLLASLNMDGRTKGFYIIEPGEARFVADSMSVAKGTALNDKMGMLMHQLDSVENINDMDLYLGFVKKVYDGERSNPVGRYFGIEYLKFADPENIETMIADAPEEFVKRRRVAHYLNSARLRAATAAGKQYKDIEGETADGQQLNLSSLIKPGHYTLLDFMASWCPYCIRDFKNVKKLQEEYGSKGLDVVSIAVRDTPEDTRAAVERHKMTWPVIYNTQRKPYDIYGFAGIPHYILIGPDGKILARSEMLSNVESVIKKNIK